MGRGLPAVVSPTSAPPLTPLVERSGARALHQGRLIACSGRVPQAGDLLDAQDAAPAEQAGACRVQHLRVGRGWPDFADLEARPGGVVEVAVGGGHRPQELTGPLGPRPGGQYGGDLNLGVEGDAGHLLLDEEWVLDALARLPPAVPCPSTDGQSQGCARPQQGGLPYLAVLHPKVALEGGQRADAEHGHRDAVHLERLGLEGVGGFPRLHAGPLVGLVQVCLGPVGAEGAQHQPRHDALTLVDVGESAGRTSSPSATAAPA